MWEDSEDGGDDAQDVAKCDPKYTRWILRAIHKIRSHRWRPSVDRICREVVRCHPKAEVGEVQEQLVLCVQDGKVHKVIHKGLPSYRDPGVFKPKDLLTLIELAICAPTDQKGSSFVSIENYIKKSYPDEYGCDAFNSELRSQLTLAVRKGVTSGRLVTDGLLYKIAETSDSPMNDQNCGLRIAESNAASRKKRKHVPRISESSAPMAKKKKTLVNSSALTIREGHADQPVPGNAKSTKLFAKKGEHAQRTVDNCAKSVKEDEYEAQTACTWEGLQGGQSKYTEWILNAICKIKNDRQRPCEDRICCEVLKAHQDASVQEIKEHLDLCTQVGKILKGSFKGKTSYRIPDGLIKDSKYKHKVRKQNLLQKLEEAITNLAEEGGSSLTRIKKYMGHKYKIKFLHVVAKEGVACGRLQRHGRSRYRIARSSDKPSCVGGILDENVGVAYMIQAEDVETTSPATSISRESKVDIQYAATGQDLSHLELLIPTRCKYCRRYFTSMSRYLIHKRRHEQTIKPYWYRKPCKLCGRPASHSHLCNSSHINLSQSSVKPYRATTKRECTRCRKIFLNIDQLNEHKCKRYWPNRRRSCAKCGYRRVKNEKCPQICKPCARSLMAQGMTEYELSQLKWTLHKCQTCRRYFLDAEKLKQHEMIKHKRTCVACGNARKLRRYPLVCKRCGEAQEEQGLNPLGMTENDLQVKVHKCQWCNETFQSLVKLKKHEVFQHRGRCAGCGSLCIMHEKHPRLCKPCVDSVKTFKVTNQDWEKKVYRCKSKTCNKWFLHLEMLKEHELNEHITMIKCVVCSNGSRMHEKYPQICKLCHDSVTGTKTSKVVLSETQPNDPDLHPNEPVIWIPITKCEWCGEQSLKHDEHPRLCKKCYELGITNHDLEKKRCKACNKWFLHREKLTEHEFSEHGIHVTCVLCGQPTAKHKEHPHLCKNCNNTLVAGTCNNWAQNSTANVTCVVNKPVVMKVCLTVAKSASQGQAGNSNAQVTCVVCGQQSAAYGKQVCMNCNQSPSSLPANGKKVSRGPVKTFTKQITSDEVKTYQNQNIIACDWCGEQSVKHEDHPRLCKKCYMSLSDQITAAKNNKKAGQEPSTCVENVTSKTNSAPQEQPLVMYKCWQCSKAFLQYDELKAHETAKHKEVTISASRTKTKSPEEQAVVMYGCSFCSKTFLQLQELTAHEMAEHKDTLILHRRGRCTRCGSLGAIMHEKHPRLCKSCGDSVKPFRIANQNLEKQMTKCITCNKWFVHLEKLKEHELNEHGTHSEHETPHIRKMVTKTKSPPQK